jgi:serine/tyrosine/threonine adenylyltransferase
MLTFDNQLIRQLPGDPIQGAGVRQVRGAIWSKASPTPVSAPTLIAHSAEIARELGLSEADMASPALLAALCGNALLPGMSAYATCYGGHQFGHWAGQLGDGRAIYLGEAVSAKGARKSARFELQLKGAGPTPYSRSADGRAVLRSSIREFLCSEAMHHLGVPTTRALSLVGTGDAVVRDMFYDGHPRAEPGAIVCRVAPSFLRFGHFELPAARGDTALLRQLVDFAITRDFPHITAADPIERISQWLTDIATRTGTLVAWWMSVGFVHGVMNTDNMSILGLTIDYGPYGWVEDFDPGWTPNTTDAEGRRYGFGRQPEIARWNLERLCVALRPLMPDDATMRTQIEAALLAYDTAYGATTTARFAHKLGFATWRDEHGPLLDTLFELLFHSEADMSDFFWRLGEIDLDSDTASDAASAATHAAHLAHSSYDSSRWASQANGWRDWFTRYAQLHSPKLSAGDTAFNTQSRSKIMRTANPRYVLRNYLAQQAIEAAEAGDFGPINTLLDVLRQPYTEQAGRSDFAQKRPEWARHKAGCSALSCSS